MPWPETGIRSSALNDPRITPGLRDELITAELRQRLEQLDPSRLQTEPLDPAEAAGRLSAHLEAVTRRRLDRMEPEAQAAEINRLVAGLDAGEVLKLPPELLLGVLGDTGSLLGANELPPRPEIPLSASDLLVNGSGQPTLGTELKSELQSANHVDLICAFVIWTGVRIVREELADLVSRGGRVRVITTTYMGATEPKALNALVDLGAEVRVAYDARITKLHAKAWLLEREGGLTTAFIGSSNLSYTALLDGLEWNVRLAERDAGYLISRVRATFDTHWEDDHFDSYDPQRDGERLRKALGQDAQRRTGKTTVSFHGLDVHPYPHQQRMLDKLAVERERHDRHKNLVVAATGTGKTVVAALDYRNLCRRAGKDLSLLFVAHRRRILDQSRAMFRAVLRNESFGELLGDDERPAVGRHVFAMVQSLDSGEIERIAPDAYNIVVIDEFHHAAAPTYRRLLDHVDPQELLGLTATPERMDGQDIVEWFGDRIAVELRLWEAIDQGFLSPFQYFGIADGTDLRDLEWRRGGYATSELEKVLTGDDVRVGKLLEGLNSIVAEPPEMRALGFCVSVAHAEYMARKFSEAGLASLAISGATPSDERDAALRRLSSGDLRVLFSVDVLGEGVDVPAVDTVLLLRPTQSATVLTQQLGRGLRKAEGKSCLTVIDLIGQQHRQFRFDRRLRALVDTSQGGIAAQVEADFPFLPAGCEINLDRVSREIILENLKDAARLGQWRTLVEDLEALPDVGLSEFLERTERAPSDLYRSRDRTWTGLRRTADRPTPPPGPDEDKLLGSLWRLMHLDDDERVRFYTELLGRETTPPATGFDPRERRMLLMLLYDLWGVNRSFETIDDGLAAVWPNEAVRSELIDLMEVLGDRSETLTRPLGLDPQIPVATHGRYSRDEALAAFGAGSAKNPPQLREGVKWVEEANADLFFVTLQKSEKDYSPTTLYRDYAISPELFHWESQSTLTERAPTAQRYMNHQARGSSVVLFVRERAKTSTSATAPYTCLGPATYVEHRGERPLSITWRLRDSMPAELFESARAVAAA